MKVKKFPQSCLLFKTTEQLILVDPGSINFNEAFMDEWKKADAVLVTHRHADHIKADKLKEFNTPIYSTKEVSEHYPDLNINIVKENDVIDIGKVKTEVVRAVHGFHPRMKANNGEVFENVGFIIDDQTTRAYVTSDTIFFNNNYKADAVFAPVTGTCITMDAATTALFTKEVGAKKLFVVHMDNEIYKTDTEQVRKTLSEQDIDFTIAQNGEEYEV